MTRKFHPKETAPGTGRDAGKGLSMFRGKNVEPIRGLPDIKPTRARLEELRMFMEKTAQSFVFPLPVGDGSEELFDLPIDPV